MRLLLNSSVPKPFPWSVWYVLQDFEFARIRYKSPLVEQIMKSVRERYGIGYLDTFKRWVHLNNVCIDSGGFYSPLRKAKMKGIRRPRDARVRIGWWEKGVYSKKVWDERAGVYVRDRFAVDGFEVYYRK
jgi:hypothetical protein